jgi:hypothetical protein
MLWAASCFGAQRLGLGLAGQGGGTLAGSGFPKLAQVGVQKAQACYDAAVVAWLLAAVRAPLPLRPSLPPMPGIPCLAPVYERIMIAKRFVDVDVDVDTSWTINAHWLTRPSRDIRGGASWGGVGLAGPRVLHPQFIWQCVRATAPMPLQQSVRVLAVSLCLQTSAVAPLRPAGCSSPSTSFAASGLVSLPLLRFDAGLAIRSCFFGVPRFIGQRSHAAYTDTSGAQPCARWALLHSGRSPAQGTPPKRAPLKAAITSCMDGCDAGVWAGCVQHHDYARELDALDFRL